MSLGQCCGMNMKTWDCVYDLVLPEEWDENRCPNPATCCYDNGDERIPLCAEHYDAWCKDCKEEGDGTSPIWYSAAWIERDEGASE